MRQAIGIVVAITAVAAVTAAGFAMATEQARYDVLRKLDERVEVRRYAPALVAETMIEGSLDFRRASDAGFRRLADYIFGANEGRREIAMTAPVTVAYESDERDGTKIAMTAPVNTGRAADGAWRMRFVMPSTWTLETLPRPKDARVVVKTTPAREVAVLRFSGMGTANQFQQRERELLDALAAADIRTRDAPWTQRYDPPWVLPFLRRNEVAVEVEGRTVSIR